MKAETIEALQRLCRELQDLARVVSYATNSQTESLYNAAETLHDQLNKENDP